MSFVNNKVIHWWYYVCQKSGSPDLCNLVGINVFNLPQIHKRHEI